MTNYHPILTISFGKKSNILLVLTLLLVTSCKTTLVSLDNKRLPIEVREHFKELTFDSLSNKLIIPQPIEVENGNKMDVYELLAKLNINKVEGVLYKTSYKHLPSQLQSMFPVSKKNFTVNLSAKFCCSNHSPNDCVNSEKQVEDTSRVKGCTRWKVRLLD